MARMRTIKPEAATSETLAAVPRAVRWTFATLWTHCDDDGRAVNNPRLIKAAIYPLDDDMTPEAVADELAELAGVGALCFYEIDGKEYLHIPSWPAHQHPNRKFASKLPECPRSEHGGTTHVRLTANSMTEQEPGTSVVVVEGQVVVGGETGRDAATAQTIVAEWIERAPKRPPSQVVGQVAKLTAQMLAEGIHPDDVRRGMAAWMAKGLHPSTLPSVVNEVMNTPVINGHGKASTKAAGWLALGSTA